MFSVENTGFKIEKHRDEGACQKYRQNQSWRWNSEVPQSSGSLSRCTLGDLILFITSILLTSRWKIFISNLDFALELYSHSVYLDVYLIGIASGICLRWHTPFSISTAVLHLGKSHNALSQESPKPQQTPWPLSSIQQVLSTVPVK